jgi:hypothetical protein
MAGLDQGGFGFCAMGVDVHAGEIRNKLLVSVLQRAKGLGVFIIEGTVDEDVIGRDGRRRGQWSIERQGLEVPNHTADVIQGDRGVLPRTDVAVVGSVGDFKEEFNMSASDTLTPLLSTPWVDASGKTLSVRALPGLRPELIKTLNATYPGIINPTIQTLLATCCGLADTELGHIDFTGCCFPEEQTQ